MIFAQRDQETNAPAVHLRNSFNPEICKKIMEDVVKQAPAEKATHAHGDGIDSIDEKRMSTVRWFVDHGFEQHLRQAVNLANFNAGWKYDIIKPEILQFTEYAPKDHYDWHTDGTCDHHAARYWQETEQQQNLCETRDPELLGTVRKISASVILNDDYEGGELEFVILNEKAQVEITKITPEVGSVVVFPSFIMHRVLPVTKGTRYSVVAWYGGPPFK